MVKSVCEWTANLREYAAGCRAVTPLLNRDTLTNAQEWQCRIVGSTLLAWLRQHGPRFLQERAVLCKMLEIDHDPTIVFTSNMPGLVAAREIVGPDHEQVVYLLGDELADLPPQIADSGYKWHVHFWSFFLPEVEPEFEAEARAKYPIQPNCRYWVHTEGTMWAANAGRDFDHLWQWDGHKPELLEEAMSYRVY